MTEGQEPDGALWHRAQEGDEGAFERIFDRHANRIYNFCFRATGSWDRAEDSLSIVFLQAWRSRHQVHEGRDSLLPWLLAIANNTCRNERRSRRRHTRLLARLESVDRGIDPDFSSEVDFRVDDQERVQSMLTALNKISPNERDLIRLCYFGDLTIEQAALALGIPVGTAKSRLSRARARLRADLATSHGVVAASNDRPSEEPA